MKSNGCLNCMFYDVCDANGPCDYKSALNEDDEQMDYYEEYLSAWEAYVGEDEESRSYFDRREYRKKNGGDY